MTSPLSPFHLMRFVIMETVATVALAAGVLDRFAGFSIFPQPIMGWAALCLGMGLSVCAALLLIMAKRKSLLSTIEGPGSIKAQQPGLYNSKR